MTLLLMDESLREAACQGNLHSLKRLVQAGSNVNSQNSMNGWTALHWACKRGHVEVVKHLLQHGADPSVANHKGELPVHVTTSSEVLTLFPEESRISMGNGGRNTEFELPFVPNYLKNPPFPYYDMTESSPQYTTPMKNSVSLVPILTEDFQAVSLAASEETSNGCNTSDQKMPATVSSCSASSSPSSSLPLLVKARLAESGESDFVEVEVEPMSFQTLLRACCEELEVPMVEVSKIRKLPNVIVRKDQDVQRMKTGQELEIVLKPLPF